VQLFNEKCSRSPDTGDGHGCHKEVLSSGTRWVGFVSIRSGNRADVCSYSFG
jgi:hypothetical protein